MKPGGAELQLGVEAAEISPMAALPPGIPEKPLSARSPPAADSPDRGIKGRVPFGDTLEVFVVG